MKHEAPEKKLINQFVKCLYNKRDKDLCIELLLNNNCKSRTFADVEFISKTNVHWVIEAKSNESSDRYNTVHKVFGDLLKETGRPNRKNCRYAILLPKSALEFYSKSFQSIAKDKFVGFSKLIPINTVFLCGQSEIQEITWRELYEAHKA